LRALGLFWKAMKNKELCSAFGVFGLRMSCPGGCHFSLWRNGGTDLQN
jgi:hypothetical protein